MIEDDDKIAASRSTTPKVWMLSSATIGTIARSELPQRKIRRTYADGIGNVATGRGLRQRAHEHAGNGNEDA
jgi:hypothetical protein